MFLSTDKIHLIPIDEYWVYYKSRSADKKMVPSNQRFRMSQYFNQFRILEEQWYLVKDQVRNWNEDEQDVVLF